MRARFSRLSLSLSGFRIILEENRKMGKKYCDPSTLQYYGAMIKMPLFQAIHSFVMHDILVS